MLGKVYCVICVSERRTILFRQQRHRERKAEKRMCSIRGQCLFFNWSQKEVQKRKNDNAFSSTSAKKITALQTPGTISIDSRIFPRAPISLPQLPEAGCLRMPSRLTGFLTTRPDFHSKVGVVMFETAFETLRWVFRWLIPSFLDSSTCQSFRWFISSFIQSAS